MRHGSCLQKALSSGKGQPRPRFEASTPRFVTRRREVSGWLGHRNSFHVTVVSHFHLPHQQQQDRTTERSPRWHRDRSIANCSIANCTFLMPAATPHIFPPFANVVERKSSAVCIAICDIIDKWRLPNNQHFCFIFGFPDTFCSSLSQFHDVD